MTDGLLTGDGTWQRWVQRLSRRVRQWQGTEPRTRIQIRTERYVYGGWCVCPHVLRTGDIAYSFDTGGDLELEQALLDRFGARVYIFDPDPDVAARAEAAGLLQKFQFYAIRVGSENRSRDPNGGVEGARMVRLPDLMRMLGHRRLDLVKLNVGTAAAAIRDLVAHKVDVRQLLLAVPATTTTDERDRVEAMVADLERHGFRIFDISPDGRRYSFIRTDFEAL